MTGMLLRSRASKSTVLDMINLSSGLPPAIASIIRDYLAIYITKYDRLLHIDKFFGRFKLRRKCNRRQAKQALWVEQFLEHLFAKD